MGRCWRIELLGPVRLCRDDEAPLPIPGQESALLLAYPACHSPAPQPREVIAEMLWPREAPEVGRRRLRGLLHELHQQWIASGVAASPILVARRTTLQLEPAVVSSDVAEFRAALQAGRQADDPDERRRWLARAGALYRGELLPGFYDEWVILERERLAATYLEVLRQLTAALERAGDLDGALATARHAVAVDPLREEVHYDVMRLYAALGQPAATLRQYQELERILREEFGETPSAEVRALAEEQRDHARTLVLARRPSHSPPESGRPTEPCRDPPLTRLPLQLTRFFGREEEIAQLAEILSSWRAWSRSSAALWSGPKRAPTTRCATRCWSRCGSMPGSNWPRSGR
jgi:DNA-binding SARP family transcriptional activator